MAKRRLAADAMAASVNRQILLKSRPEGAPGLGNFELAKNPGRYSFAVVEGNKGARQPEPPPFLTIASETRDPHRPLLAPLVFVMTRHPDRRVRRTIGDPRFDQVFPVLYPL
jgi:hypothetical protein